MTKLLKCHFDYEIIYLQARQYDYTKILLQNILSDCPVYTSMFQLKILAQGTLSIAAGGLKLTVVVCLSKNNIGLV